MSRNKPLSASGSSSKRDSLYRTVLLKNCWSRSQFQDATPLSAEKAPSAVQDVYRQDEQQEVARDNEEENTFVFPDPDALIGVRSGPHDAENQWLDSLLESLGADDDFETEVVSGLPGDEDDELLSPLYSPMSSSDDLVDHHDMYSIAVPYPVPYPPVHAPPVPAWFELTPSSSPSPSDSLDASPPLYDDPLPYYYVDDVEDMPVPDAIEDTSDDESDGPSTPSTQSTSSPPLSSDSVSPISPPTPTERRPLHSRPHVYIDAESSYFYPFHFDSFAPADSVRAYHSPIYQDC